MDTHQQGQLVRLVRGRPDTEQLAALTAAVLARAAAYEGQHGGTAGGGPALARRCPSARTRPFAGSHGRRDEPSGAA
ncbi:acyl-CoA carboxylase epsilon subunit [Streptomyces sp. NBC_01276]|uniref:acyl-CoA carboxylase epsilon subunit n=2 Tax=unclassified Streptomyces TaxID=2593676 RepID=UPI002F9195ED